ncbi:hypothetical protein ROS217_00770 [Roseovarius sp. 217]|jgi:hypothetical protein|nr:hypothetical protein ROS217_00770 [Roseovarius sp. 217]|tara:strand:- start:754 stop:900 length:147 start_codon:yes stop_codon:yes gene_type:complete
MEITAVASASSEIDLFRPDGTMNLENILCQIDTNHHILHLAVLLFAWL